MSKQAEITQVELVKIAKAVLKGCYIQIENGYWSGGPGACYFPAICCVHCSYKEYAKHHNSRKAKHDNNCIVLRAKKIIAESLPPATARKMKKSTQELLEKNLKSVEDDAPPT